MADVIMPMLTLWICLGYITYAHATRNDPVFLSLDDQSTDLAMIMNHGQIDYHVWQDELDMVEELEARKSQFTEPPTDEFFTDEATNGTRIKRFTMDKESSRWEHGIIPYTFDDVIDNKTRQHIIKDIFGLFEYWTHFRFIPWNSSIPELYNLNHQNYLKFVAKNNRCWSYLGNTRGRGQPISCCKEDRCIHEIGHSLGFFHELESPLRDDYIRVNTGNILDGMHANFKKSSLENGKTFGYYDMSTVMGYAPNSFSKNLRETITVLDPESRYLTIKKDLSAYYMFYEAQTLYNMKDEKCPGMVDDCLNGGYLSYVISTCRCRCPRGLDHVTKCATAIGADVCGGVIELSGKLKHVNITSPYYPRSYKISQPCVWFIKGPTGSKITAEFSVFNIPRVGNKCSTFMEMRFALPGQPGIKYCGDGFSKTVVSQEEYLSFYVDTTIKDHNVYVLFSLSAKLIEPEDMSYSVSDKGISYRGHVDYTHDFQPCLHWEQMTNCTFNTFKVDSVNLEESYCRNPGHGTEPWCYVNKENCARAYCDVCHLRKCKDLFDNCELELLKNPFYCYLNIEAKRGCRQTCNLCPDNIKQVRNIQCGSPPAFVSDGELVPDNVTTTYNVGDVVTYICTHNTSNGNGTSMCTSEGTWTYVGYVCDDNPLCVDKRSDCNVLLYRNPMMCSEFTSFSTKKCANTCGLCTANNNIVSQSECQPDWYLTGNVTEVSQGPYYAGNVARFTCPKGFAVVVGNLQRACQKSGRFTGIVPRCSAIEDSVTDLYHVSIRRRSHTPKPDTVYMFSNPFYRIQRQGEIIAWQFYSLYRGEAFFQIWRQAGNSTSYKLLSSFHVADTNRDRLMTVYVPLQQRTTVKPGDNIGVYIPQKKPGGIMYDKCKTEYDTQGGGHVTPLHPGPWYAGKYYRMAPSTSCYLFSVSAKIGPVRILDIQDLRLSWSRFLNRHG